MMIGVVLNISRQNKNYIVRGIMKIGLVADDSEKINTKSLYCLSLNTIKT